MDTLQAARKIVDNGGGTFYMLAGSIMEKRPTNLPLDQWVVGVEPKNGENKIYDLAVHTVYEVATYLFEFVAYAHDPEEFFGAWIDDGKLYMDHVLITPDKDEALGLARERGEKAIFNLKTKETVTL
jgi:hypothetical protein